MRAPAIVLALLGIACSAADAAESLALSDLGYFDKPGLSVMVFSDYYPDGHQSGVTIIQHGVRVAAMGQRSS